MTNSPGIYLFYLLYHRMVLAFGQETSRWLLVLFVCASCIALLVKSRRRQLASQEAEDQKAASQAKTLASNAETPAV